MIQMSFTAQELFCMAYLLKKPKMYGIPNAMTENREKQIRETVDSLLQQELAEMDFDGKISLKEAYRSLVDCYCDCQKCLTVNLQREDGTAQSLIFWLCDGGYTMAEVLGERYVFSAAEESMIRGLVDKTVYSGDCCLHVPEAVIPQIQLTKAKRLCAEEKPEEAVRLLRQNGATEDMARMITDGLQEKARYLGLLLMDMRHGDCRKAEAAYLAGRGMLLALGERVVNLRSCAVFTACHLQKMQDHVSQLTESFLQRGDAQ